MLKRKPFRKIDDNLRMKSRRRDVEEFADFIYDDLKNAFPKFPFDREPSRKTCKTPQKKEAGQEESRLAFCTRATPRISNCSNRTASSFTFKPGAIETIAKNGRKKRRKFDCANKDCESLPSASVTISEESTLSCPPDDENSHEAEVYLTAQMESTTADEFVFDDQKPPYQPSKLLIPSKVDDNSGLHKAQACEGSGDVMHLFNQFETCFNKLVDDFLNKIDKCSPTVRQSFDTHGRTVKGTLLSCIFNERCKENTNNVSMKNTAPASLITTSLWTAERARRRDEALGTNIEPVFQFPDGTCFRHPILPPGWNVSISRMEKVPYYTHPDFGSTLYCPVPLPSDDGTIKGTRLIYQIGTPVNAKCFGGDTSGARNGENKSANEDHGHLERNLRESLSSEDPVEHIHASATKSFPCQEIQEQHSNLNEPTGPILDDCVPDHEHRSSSFSDDDDLLAEYSVSEEREHLNDCDTVTRDITPSQSVGIAHEHEHSSNPTSCSDSLTNIDSPHFQKYVHCHDGEILGPSPLREKNVESGNDDSQPHSENKTTCNLIAIQTGLYGADDNVLDSKAIVHSPVLSSMSPARAILGKTSDDDKYCRLDGSPPGKISELDDLDESPCEATIMKHLKKRDERFLSFQSQGLINQETGFWAGNGISPEHARTFLKKNTSNCGNCNACHAAQCFRCSLCRFIPPSDCGTEPCVFRCCGNIKKNNAFQRKDRCLSVSDRVYCKRSDKESDDESDNESDSETWFWGTIQLVTDRYTFTVKFDDGCIEDEIIDEDLLTQFEVDLYNQIYFLNQSVNFVLHPDDNEED